MIWRQSFRKYSNCLDKMEEYNKEYKICTVIVTYNRLDLLKGAIASLKAQEYPMDLLVVNNGSTDGTKEYLEDMEGIILINQDNVGGAGGFYTGFKYAAEHGYDFAWVMDDDIIARPDTLLELVKAYDFLKGEENVGFLCSNVTNSEGYMVNNPEVDNVKLNPTYHSSWNKYLGKGLIGVKSATFVSVFVPCAVVRKVGLPIKEFFIWGDDTEYTTRISKKYKYNSFLVGMSEIQHLRVGDKPIKLVELTDKNRIKMYQNSIRNEIFLNKKGYYDSKHNVIFILWHFVTFGKLLAKASFFKLKIFIKGIYQGLTFNPRIQYPV